MKKRFTQLVAASAVCLPLAAATYMRVVQNDGKVEIYDVTNVNRVDFVEESDLYPYVDLGLPSGTLWATYNVGASKPEEYGNYYAWGETEPKEHYTLENYKWYNGSSVSDFTKYNYRDKNITLFPEDDAASVNWGATWRLPTIEECKELANNCTATVETIGGVIGTKFTAKNGNSIFFPAAGYNYNDTLHLNADRGCYWSSQISETSRFQGREFEIMGVYTDFYSNYRPCGAPVRAVRVEKVPNTDTLEIPTPIDTTKKDTVAHNYEYVDLGLPSGTLWATYNVGASKPGEYGNYYSWGEIEPKEHYTLENYKWYNGSSASDFTKYNYRDKNITLFPEDDAASVNWGATWRLPTIEECKELANNCTATVETIGGVIGTKFTAKNGNSIFFPAAGYNYNDTLHLNADRGCYWSSQISETSRFQGREFEIMGVYTDFYSNYRPCGAPVRAVRVEKVPNTDTLEIPTPIDTTKKDTVVPNYEYVDLDLPSGTLWAANNIGATAQGEIGYYFAWGEIEPKETYTLENYKWYNGSSSSDFTKYNHRDKILTLLSEDDAATVNWGTDWRMPTLSEYKELKDYCTVSDDTIKGVSGITFTGKNGNWIFFPGASYMDADTLGTNDHRGIYWTSQLYSEDTRFQGRVFEFFGKNNISYYSNYRPCGSPVRAVRVEKSSAKE